MVHTLLARWTGLDTEQRHCHRHTRSHTQTVGSHIACSLCWTHTQGRDVFEPGDTQRAGMSSSPRPNMEFQALHQAHRNRCKNTDAYMCRHSLSFHLHHTLRTELFASFLYLLEQIPLGKDRGATNRPHGALGIVRGDGCV